MKVLAVGSALFLVALVAAVLLLSCSQPTAPTIAEHASAGPFAVNRDGSRARIVAPWEPMPKIITSCSPSMPCKQVVVWPDQKVKSE